MATVTDQIRSADEAICRNIDALSEQRALLSQNVLAQLRNLVEGVAVRLETGSADAEFTYAGIASALAFVRADARFSFLGKFHKLIQASASHYTLDGDSSERLMLKYYEYLQRVRRLLRDCCGIDALRNLDAFPVDLDPSLREYHEKIAARIAAARSAPSDNQRGDRYYIHRARPFFVDGAIFYEVSCYPAINKVNKTDRIVAFTDIDIADEYAGTLTMHHDEIQVLGQVMPITILAQWSVSIRPCELTNFARLLGIAITARTNSSEYEYLMRWLTVTGANLLDLVGTPDDLYAAVRAGATRGSTKPQLFPVLDAARHLLATEAPGHNALRYLLLRMRNEVLKSQYAWEANARLSDLHLQYGCIPFDTMPFCTSLIGHNPRYWDLMAALDVGGRTHELMARRVKNNVEHDGVLYTPAADLEEFGDVHELIATYNSNLYHAHVERRLLFDKGHVFISGYENDTVAIINKLQQYASTGVAGYAAAVERWLGEAPRGIDDPIKEDALKRLFRDSRVALVYGAAGTGKSTMVNHIASYFNDSTKLFLTHTNPAIDNLRRKVQAQNSVFRTISRHNYSADTDEAFDVLVIDECSTVSNADLIKVLDNTSFKLVVLIGDVFQIESIQFGNWFALMRSFVPANSVFELTTPFRTKNDSLLAFWTKVRAISDDIAEIIARNGYSTVLDATLFDTDSHVRDEIILCLNYDGLYGINNINRFLQSSNPASAVTWRVSTYKVGDPVLFNETTRFRPVIYNNLKGWVVGIEVFVGRIQFDVELDRPLTEFDVGRADLEWVRDSVVRFSVYDYDVSDEDDDSVVTTVPFQVAYAVSIHKAQGLEYDSVKIVVTDANEDDITHSILYTAVTRARDQLRIYWTPESQQAVLKNLRCAPNGKDVALLSARRGLTPSVVVH